MSKYKPYLDTRLDLGFMGFYTQLMTHSYEMNHYNYINLYWYFFKWNGNFKLYRPGEHR